jgi:pilus assembly protein CpaB
VTYVTYRFLKARLQPPDETISVVVATQNLSLGARVTEKDVRVAAWPASMPLVGSFSDPNQAIGRGVLVGMQPNEPVLDSKLAPKEMGAGLSVAIPDGMRAVAIQVNDIIGVAGFVLPGSRVDLILTGVPQNFNEPASKIVMENLQVLAAGQNVQQDVNGRPQPVQVVTLLVTPEQAQKITLATADGPIRLALRNPLDLKDVNTRLTPRSVLYTSANALGEAPAPKPSPKRAAAPRPAVPRPAPVPVVAAPPLPAPPRVVTVEVIMGPNRATSTFTEKGTGDETSGRDKQ